MKETINIKAHTIPAHQIEVDWPAGRFKEDGKYRFAMFTPAGNLKVKQTVQQLIKNSGGKVKWPDVENALYELDYDKYGEAGDTAVRDSVWSFLKQNDLLEEQ